MRSLTLAAVAFLLPALGYGQESAAFLKIGAGARAIGMGGSQAGATDDIYSIAWNPAGLAGLKSRELGLMYGQMAADMRYNFVGYAHPAKGGTFGFAARHLSQGTIDGRDSGGRPTGGYAASDTAVDLAYGARLSESTRLGGVVRVIRSSIAEASAQSYAVDLGALYSMERRGPGVPQIGLAVQNLGPGMRFLDDSSPLPLTAAVGLGYRLPAGLTLACDYRHRPHSRSSEASIGTEYAVLGNLSLRAGYGAAQTSNTNPVSRLSGLAGGFGLRLKGYVLDYAITPFGEIGNAHRFSLGARF